MIFRLEINGNELTVEPKHVDEMIRFVSNYKGKEFYSALAFPNGHYSLLFHRGDVDNVTRYDEDQETLSHIYDEYVRLKNDNVQ